MFICCLTPGTSFSTLQLSEFSILGLFQCQHHQWQPTLQPAVGQGGGDWDLDFSGSSEPSDTSESAEAVENHAMEGENIDRVQDL